MDCEGNRGAKQEAEQIETTGRIKQEAIEGWSNVRCFVAQDIKMTADRTMGAERNVSTTPAPDKPEPITPFPASISD